ncbi:MAG TPA: hypothetical protein VNU26_13490, partial [Mycobacteriales bacterium]|nr:hypothetical protein [Mycobacteriales bacterium]
MLQLATEAPGQYAAASGTLELLWLLIALPLLGSAVLLLGGRRTDEWGPFLAIGAVLSSFLLAVLSFLELRSLEESA